MRFWPDHQTFLSLSKTRSTLLINKKRAQFYINTPRKSFPLIISQRFARSLLLETRGEPSEKRREELIPYLASEILGHWNLIIIIESMMKSLECCVSISFDLIPVQIKSDSLCSARRTDSRTRVDLKRPTAAPASLKDSRDQDAAKSKLSISWSSLSSFPVTSTRTSC